MFTPLRQSPVQTSAQIDTYGGKICFIAGLDRPHARQAYNLYKQHSKRTGATFDDAELSVTSGQTLIRFVWETDIGFGQVDLWAIPWTMLLVEDQLAPTEGMINIIGFIVSKNV